MTPVDLLSHLAVQVRHDPVLALANVVVHLFGFGIAFEEA